MTLRPRSDCSATADGPAGLRIPALAGTTGDRSRRGTRQYRARSALKRPLDRHVPRPVTSIGPTAVPRGSRDRVPCQPDVPRSNQGGRQCRPLCCELPVPGDSIACSPQRSRSLWSPPPAAGAVATTVRPRPSPLRYLNRHPHPATRQPRHRRPATRRHHHRHPATRRHHHPHPATRRPRHPHRATRRPRHRHPATRPRHHRHLWRRPIRSPSRSTAASWYSVSKRRRPMAGIPHPHSAPWPATP